MAAKLASLAVFGVLLLALVGVADGASTTVTKAEFNALKTEFNAFKASTNERISANVTRDNGQAAAIEGLEGKVSALEGRVTDLEKAPGGEEPPVEEPPVEEPPVEEPPVEEPPVEEPTGCTSTVSSLSAVQANLGAGKVVCIADGSYGSLSFNGPGTVVALHPGSVTLTGATIGGTDGHLERVKVTNGVTIAVGSTGATLAHSTVTGGGQGVSICPSSTTACTNVRIIGNRLVGPFGEDALHSNRTNGLLMEGNEITKVAENGNHSDCYQNVWVSSNIVFKKNYVHDNRCQGFFVKDQASLCSGGSGICGPINGIQVEDNLMVRNHEPCAISGCGQPVILQIFGPYTNLTISRNTLWGDGYDSMLALREGVGTGTTISNNVIYRFWTDTNASGASFSNNTLCVIEGSWPSSRPGTETNCSSTTPTPAGRGVDWSPAEQHYGV